MPRLDLLPYLMAALLALASVACQPEIGDDCSVSTDCSAAGDRLCDTTQPQGYCTIFNCEPDTCPEEAACIAFKRTLSTAEACTGQQRDTRLERTFCMRRCDDDEDCRSGYDCINMNAPDNPYGAVLVDRGGNGKVCAVPLSAEELPEDFDTEVCTGSDAGADAPPLPVRDAGSDAADGGGDAGADANDPDAGALDAGELDAGEAGTGDAADDA